MTELPEKCTIGRLRYWNTPTSNWAAGRIEEMEGAIHRALCCTPLVRDGAIIYDCGDPWEQLRSALP